jgi:hypothetical protein
MLAKSLLSPILDNEALTRDLGDAEARILVEWLVERAERLAAAAVSERFARGEVALLCRRARAIGRFVGLWARQAFGPAYQLAAAERFAWPLPTGPEDPCELMQVILEWEGQQEE